MLQLDARKLQTARMDPAFLRNWLHIGWKTCFKNFHFQVLIQQQRQIYLITAKIYACLTYFKQLQIHLHLMQVVCQVTGASRAWFPCGTIWLCARYIPSPYQHALSCVQHHCVFNVPSCTNLQTDGSNISDIAQVAITIRILSLDYTTKHVLTILPLKGRTRG